LTVFSYAKKVLLTAKRGKERLKRAKLRGLWAEKGKIVF